MSSKTASAIPVIDLFAGPGGLGEGFSSFPRRGARRFQIALSIEKDPYAHATLTLRAFFRQFPRGKVPEKYYRYVRKQLSREELFASYPDQAEAALEEARCLTLGKDNVCELIDSHLAGAKSWVLIGGPPCQAYSLVGRSRMLGGIERRKNESEEAFNTRRQGEFEQDHRHQLYREYLKIIAHSWPPIFVMENVKGLLSSKMNGKLIFPRILDDLRNPAKAVAHTGTPQKYNIHSLTVSGSDLFGEGLESSDYLIKAENHGIPQARHRVILLGIRSDIDPGRVPLLAKTPPPAVSSVLSDLPRLTSGVSRENGRTPWDVLSSIRDQPWWIELEKSPSMQDVVEQLEKALLKAPKRINRGDSFVETSRRPTLDWFHDRRLGGACNHETRSHISGDLERYFFCAGFARARGRSPQLRDFPTALLPEHANVADAVAGGKFGDRFRVQVASKPSTTVTSHISKDGHYFIHPDPTQCRSLTVREAARLQTFPDNYFFEGPRTQQFHQVGNAVPPLLAYQIAEVVDSVLATLQPA